MNLLNRSMRPLSFKTFRTALVISLAMPLLLADSSKGASCVPPPSGLVSWWAGEGSAADTSGTNNGVLVGGVAFTNGMVGQAFLLNGFDSYIRVPHSPSLDLPNGLTVEFWFNNLRTDSYVYGLIANRGSETGPIPFGINVTSSGLAVYFKDPSVSSSFETTPYLPVPTPRTWHHLAATYQQATSSNVLVSAYLDGALIQSASWPGNLANLLNTNPITIGASMEYPTYEYFNGVIDEVSLYNRALSSSEVQSIYSAGSAGKCTGLAAPAVITEPGNQTVFAGQSASFSVTASGTAPLSYQWLFNAAPIANQTNSTLLLSNVQSGQAGLYAVAISNSVGSITSSNATLVVKQSSACDPAPANIVSWWQGEGDAADSLGRNGGTLVNGVGFMPGVVGQAFSFNGINQFVRVLDNATLDPTSALSLECWVYINAIPNNNVVMVASKESLSVHQYQITIYNNGSQLYFRPLVNAAGNLVTFNGNTALQIGQWYHVAMTYDGSFLNLYVNGTLDGSQAATGPLVTSTEALRIGGDETGPWYFNGLVDELALYSRALTSAEIQAIYNAGSSGKCPAPPFVISQPTNQTVYVGNMVNLSVTAGGTTPLSYQWLYGGNPVPGATTPSLTLTNIQVGQAGVYSVQVTNTAGSVLSSNAVVTVNVSPVCDPPPTNIVSWWQGEGDGADSLGANGGTLVNGVGFLPGVVGQAFSFNGNGQFVRIPDDATLDPTNALSLECWVYLKGVPNNNIVMIASKESFSVHQYQITLFNNGSQVVFRPLVNAGGTLVTFNGNTALQVGQWYHVAMTYDGSFLNLYVNGNLDGSLAAPGPLVTSTEALRIGGDETGWFFNGLVDELAFYSRALTGAEIQGIYNAYFAGKCSTPVAPVISGQPLDQTVTVGQTATFTAVVDGSKPMTYQWTFKGSAIVGATNATLTLANVQTTQAGSYALQVTNVAGFAISSGATLTVNFPPANLRIVNTAAIGGQVVTVPIVIAANGNENALGFSLSFATSRLTYTNVSIGTGATGAALLVNTNSAGSGALGIAIALPTGMTFSPGTQEVAEVSFIAAGLASATSTIISFTDMPTQRQLSDAQALPLAATYSSGTVTIPAANFEADVSPRPNGDKTVSITDWVQVGRYAARLDYPTNGSEYQRADCAPRSTLGDGAITVADWVQAGRYAAGLDPLTVAGGPTNDVSKKVLVRTAPQPLTSYPRQVRVGTTYLLQNQSGTVSVYLDAQGNENALGFSVSFDPTVLSYASASLGADATGATLDINASQVGAGRLAFVLAKPTGQAFTAGTKEVVKITFGVGAAVYGNYAVAMTDQPVIRQVVDPLANTLTADYLDGSMVVSPPPSLAIAESQQAVTLAWPLWATNFALQEADGATMPSLVWTNLNRPFTVSTNSALVTMPLSSTTKFYRLKH